MDKMTTSIIPYRANLLETNEGKRPMNMENFSVVATYNRLDRLVPTILVSGLPSIWSPPVDAPDLRPDSSSRYIDQNAHRMSQAPLDPLTRAVQAQRPVFDFTAVDFVTDCP